MASNRSAFAELLSGAPPSVDADAETAPMAAQAPKTTEITPAAPAANASAAAAVRALVSHARSGAAPSPAAGDEPAAAASGKNLPVSLPATEAAAEAEVGSDKAVADTETAEIDAALASTNDPVAVVPVVTAALDQPAGSKGHGVPPPAGKFAGPAAPNTAVTVAEKFPPVATEDSKAPAATPIAISARVEPASATITAADAADSMASARPKTQRTIEMARIEAPAALLHGSASPIAQPDQAPAQTAPVMPAAAPSAPMPAPADIAAALDQLAAAREALMPAEASLAIDHAEFGEVSIRFEQSREGRLSVELAAADPELHRAVTAATGAERGLQAGSDGDAGRTMSQTNQRNATAGNDPSSGDGASSRNDRDGSQRRGQARPHGALSENHTPAGVFA